ncbi:unnamed protein product [marine sediment metagenome]|uniref:Uncharacterized protein n=1 Tax=marine sediment metagenome TaxID=412755 RepID=X1LRF2_9ZZZZ
MSSWFPKIKEAYYTINQLLKALNQLSSQVYRNRDKITALEEVNECLNSEIAKFNNFIEQTEEKVEIIPELKELQSNLNERIETIQENIKSFGRGEIDFNQLLDKHFPQFEMFLNERIKQIEKIRKQHGENKAFLGKLLKTSEEKRELNYIADLLNNTERRIEEEKYDDATARSYRVIELIAQYRLRDKYQLISSDIKIKRLKELGVKNQDIEQYKSLKSVNKKIKISLQANYELLNTIEDNLGKMFIKDKEMRNLLKTRNNSILAHGLHTVRKEDAINFFNTAKLYAEEVSKEKVDLEELRKIALFPKLE